MFSLPKEWITKFNWKILTDGKDILKNLINNQIIDISRVLIYNETVEENIEKRINIIT